MKNTISFRPIISSIICLFSFFVSADTENKEIVVQPIDRYPTKSILRPGIMPTDIIQAQTNLGLKALKTVAWDIKAEFGVIPDWQGEVSYGGLEWNDYKTSHVVSFGTKYNFLSIPHVAFTASASLPVHILDEEIVRDFTVGLPVVFYNDVMAGSILGDLYKLTMRPKVEMEFNFPYWYGVQVYGDWWAMVDSTFGRITMENKDKRTWSGIGFWKEWPANLSVTYVFNHYVDLGGNFGFSDMFDTKNSMKFGLTLSVRGGRLFG